MTTATCLSALFKELWPFLNYKMYRNLLKTHFLNAQYSLENVCMASKFSLEILWLILWNGHFKIFWV